MPREAARARSRLFSAARRLFCVLSSRAEKVEDVYKRQDGGLVDIHDLVQMLQPQTFFIFARPHMRPVELLCRHLIENFVDDR